MHDPVALFQAAAQRSSAVMAAVRVEQLSAPTPCGEWSVQQLMDHMAGGPAYLPERDPASQHLKLLRDAGLITVRTAGNRRLYRADLGRVAEVAAFLDAFWAEPLARLMSVAEDRRSEGPAGP
jgi:hypothetical protein